MDYAVVPEGPGHCLGHLGLGNICLGIAGEIIHHCQDNFFLAFPQLQALVVYVHQLQGMGCHNILQGSLLLLHLEGDTLVPLPNMLLCLGSHQRPKETVAHQIEHMFKT